MVHLRRTSLYIYSCLHNIHLMWALFPTSSTAARLWVQSAMPLEIFGNSKDFEISGEEDPNTLVYCQNNQK